MTKTNRPQIACWQWWKRRSTERSVTRRESRLRFCRSWTQRHLVFGSHRILLLSFVLSKMS